MSWTRGGGPRVTYYQKYYITGPMNYRAEEHSPFTTNYFYFLNDHGDVTYFADANFTPEEIEAYEYTPWGVLFTSGSKNNLLYTAREFDFETGLQFSRMRYYSAFSERFFQKDIMLSLNYFKAFRDRPSYGKDLKELQIFSSIKKFNILCQSFDPCYEKGCKRKEK